MPSTFISLPQTDLTLITDRLDTVSSSLTLVNSSIFTTNSSLASINGKTPALGPTVMATATPVTIASNQTAIPVTQSGSWTTVETRPSTSAVTSVNSSASSVTLLALNLNRRGVIIWNDSSATLYIKLGATASTISYTVQLSTQASFNLPAPAYTGVIDGIWSSATGAARITELS